MKSKHDRFVALTTQRRALSVEDLQLIKGVSPLLWRCGSPLEAGRLLAEAEGVFVEPAVATSVAGASVARQLGHIDESASIVCLLIGHGLKYQAPRAEPESAADGAELVRAPGAARPRTVHRHGNLRRSEAGSHRGRAGVRGRPHGVGWERAYRRVTRRCRSRAAHEGNGDH
jgi:hypothetical protein